jgi:outer membrane murein-binding lipoprotein Lpp
MKNLLPTLLITLAISTILLEGCNSAPDNIQLNEKIEALSKKMDAVLQNQAEIQSKAEASAQTLASQQQEALVSRIDKINYYYATNLLREIHLGIKSDSQNLEDISTAQNNLNESVKDMEKQIKSQYGAGYESLGDKIDRIEQTVNEVRRDNRQIKEKLGIIY